MSGIRRDLPGQTRRDLVAPFGFAPVQPEASPQQAVKPPGNWQFRKSPARRLFRIETGLVAVPAAVAVMTELWPDWIERVLRVDADRHSGSLEWNIAVACVISAALFAALVRRKWRKSLAAA